MPIRGIRTEHAPANVVVDLLRRVKALEQEVLFLRNAQNPTIPFIDDWADSEERPDMVDQAIFYTTADSQLSVYLIGGGRRSVQLT